MTEIVLHAPFAGWLCALDEVADPVFAGRMIGDGVAIDPTEGLVRAPADGEVVALPDSGHAVTLRLAGGIELLIHVGLETVALNGDGFRPLVRAGASVRQGDPLIEFDLDAVARRARDMVTPLVIASPGATLRTEPTGRRVVAGERIASVSAAEREAATAVSSQSVRRSLPILAPHGIHARPAARIVALVGSHDAQVTFVRGERRADARSVTSLLTLGARHGDTIDAEAAGADAEAVLAKLAAFAEERFGDTADAAPPPPARDGGVCASPGLAIGRARQFRADDLSVAEDGDGLATEIAALDAALAAVEAMLQASAVAEAHRALLRDPALRAAAVHAVEQGRSAGYAWRAATRQAESALRATGDALLAERAADLRDIERQVLAALIGDEASQAPVAIDPGTVLIAEDLLPSEFLSLDRTNLAGICTAAGGPTAHVAILAASAGIPMLVAAGRAVLDIADDATVVLDADAGRIVAGPSAEALAEARARLSAVRERRAAEARAAAAPCVLADGTRIEVFANLGSADETAGAVEAGAEGCGLLRTEFLFLDRAEAPDEDEQAALYARIAAALGERPLIVRTLDIGGDKPVAYLPRAPEENPALGLRGIRLGLAQPALLRTQLRAILRGVPDDQCRIMLPMVVGLDEVARARRLLDDCAAELGRGDRVQLGVMVETPAAAVLAGQIATLADFVSIGTNDLTQYTLAADRGNAGVSAMVDALHPAVLRLIAQAAAGAAEQGRWTAVCGGLASDPLAAPLLVGLGATELSATPALVPAVKAALRPRDLAACRALAREACEATSAAQVRVLLEAGRA